jgi:hypothetical protein
MQVLASHRPLQGRPSRVQVWSAYSAGFILVGAALTLLYLIFVAGYLERFTPSGRPTTFQLVVGALAWAFALTAPAGAGLVGVLRLATARDRQNARRARITPAVRLARAISDDHIVATGLQLPDGSRIVPELVVGPFGAAVIHELPPAGAVMSRGVRSWEVRVGNGQIRTIENPLERATRDSDRVRAWLSGDDNDYVIKVYAAVVGTDPKAERSATCAVLAPDQVAEWLTSLPPQRTIDAGGRERIVKMVRAAL